MSMGRYMGLVNERHPDIELYTPHYERMCRPHGQRRAIPVLHPVYPGYVFASIEPERGDFQTLTHLPIRAWWIRFGARRIAVVPDFVISRVREFEGRGELIPATDDGRHSGWCTGDSVVVTSLGIKGLITKLRGESAVIESAGWRVTVAVGRLAQV
jgi:hypothetical protein